MHTYRWSKECWRDSPSYQLRCLRWSCRTRTHSLPPCARDGARMYVRLISCIIMITSFGWSTTKPFQKPCCHHAQKAINYTVCKCVTQKPKQHTFLSRTDLKVPKLHIWKSSFNEIHFKSTVNRFFIACADNMIYNYLCMMKCKTHRSTEHWFQCITEEKQTQNSENFTTLSLCFTFKCLNPSIWKDSPFTIKTC